MILLALSAVALILAFVPALLFLTNLRLYRTPPPFSSEPVPEVSILIPARNEERSIVAAVEAALRSEGVSLEVLILDDSSEDRTAALVSELAARDSRVRLLHGQPLPAGWCGKQHACFVLAQAARFPLLAFLDADVRLQPTGLARLVGFLKSSQTDLVSGIPWQETGTLLERLCLPLIHFVLLAFLPLARMRRIRHPAYGAGCGQLFLARRAAYERSGGHAAIRDSLHDGLTLPRAFRTAGLRTDLCDATDLAACRMYQSAAEVWTGLTKNATEGLATRAMLLPSTLILLGGQVLPFVLLALCWDQPAAFALSAAAASVALLPRLAGVVRFRQSRLGALLHPCGVAILVAAQWYAAARVALGKPAAWKGRTYRPEDPQQAERLHEAHVLPD